MPVFVDEMTRVLSRLLIEELGLDEARANEIGRYGAHKVAVEYGGTYLYVPKDVAFRLSERDEVIYSRFNGQNLHELAKEFDLTFTRIYQIVAQVRASKRGKQPKSKVSPVTTTADGVRT